MIFALAGNQNCGKTTLFNQLTGSNQHVGNFPGVTVDQKSGQVRGQKDCTCLLYTSRNPAPSAGRRTAPWSICRASTRCGPIPPRKS